MNNETGPYWTAPQEKPWWSLIVDGRVVATRAEDATVRRERKRLAGYCGIEFVPAAPEHLVKVAAKTDLPERITRIMRNMYAAQRKKSGGEHEANLAT